MGKNLFSVPIFFIVFRETLEAAIIVSVLLGLVEQLLLDDHKGTSTPRSATAITDGSDLDSKNDTASRPLSEDSLVQRRRLLKRLRIQIFLGAGLGLFLALAIGAAFIAVWFTQASDLWAKSEEIWEGVFNLVAAIVIFIMGLTMLKLDRAKVKWRVKLSKSFNGNATDKGANTGKWALFVLPLITVLREGLEAVVFVGGVSLGQPATSIPIATIVGIICGLVCGFVIYQFASKTALTVFLVVITNFLLLIGAGLFSKAVGNFEGHAYNVLLGSDADDAGGTGPGSYRVQGNVWHLDCCAASPTSDQGWSIFKAIFGWSNNGSLGTVLSYVFYWLAVIAVLIVMKFREGRTKVLGRESAAGARRREKREQNAIEHEKEEPDTGINELPR